MVMAAQVQAPVDHEATQFGAQIVLVPGCLRRCQDGIDIEFAEQFGFSVVEGKHVRCAVEISPGPVEFPLGFGGLEDDLHRARPAFCGKNRLGGFSQRGERGDVPLARTVEDDFGSHCPKT